MAAILFGLLLGFQEIQTDHYLTVLRRIASWLKNVSEWALPPDLLAASLDDKQILNQRRVERTVLFMDIRGFTRWSERKDPETVVNMLNEFYQLAESIIIEGGGRKPHFIGDEVMTWFDNPEQAVLTARLLSRRVNQMLRPYQLSTGAGLHLGEVVEGLMGSQTTRSYNILGDTVNTASRLVSAAQPGELLISESVAQALTLTADLPDSRPIQAKGKAQPITAYAV
jgi:class 3 adenylate cyclase